MLMGRLFGREKEAAPPEEPKARPRKLAGSAPMTVAGHVPGELVQRIDKRIAIGEFSNRSQFTVEAIRHYLEHLERKRTRRT